MIIPKETKICTKENVDSLIEEVNQYYSLPEGWDGESQEKTCAECLDHLKNLIDDYLPHDSNVLLPKTSIGTGEEVALYWAIESIGYYLIIRFCKDYFSYYREVDYDGNGEDYLDYSRLDILYRVLPRVTGYIEE